MEDDATDQKLKATAAITILLLGDAGCGKSTFLS
jgi:GTPase SAR1 family protein